MREYNSKFITQSIFLSPLHSILMPRLFAFLFLLASFSKGMSQKLVFHSVEQVLARAESDNPAIQMARLQQKVAMRDKALGWAAYYPSLGLNLNSDYNLNLPVQLIPAEIFGGPAGTFKQVRFGQNWNQSAAFDFSLPIFHPEKYAAGRSASYAAEQVKFEQQAGVNLTLQKVAAQYFQVLQLEENLALNSMLDSTAEQLYKATLARFNQQLVSRLDLNRAENLMNANKQQSLNTTASLQIARAKLAALLNISELSNMKIDDHLVSYQLSTPENQLKAAERPASRAATEAEIAQRWRAKQHLYTGLPRLSLNSRYTFSSQSNKLSDPSATHFDYGTVGLQLNVPLFKGRTNTLLFKKNQLLSEQALYKKQQTLTESAAELTEWTTRLDEKVQARTLAAHKETLALQNIQLGLDLYNQGVISLDQLFNIYNEYAQAKSSFIQTCTDAAIFQTYFMIEAKRP